MRQAKENTTISAQWLALFVVISWLSLFVHNLVDLPGLTLLSAENSIPALISLVLYLLWLRFPHNRLPRLLLIGWAFTHLIGGALLSVLPLSILPFTPAQTPLHYLMHLAYGAGQLPLILVLLGDLKSR